MITRIDDRVSRVTAAKRVRTEGEPGTYVSPRQEAAAPKAVLDAVLPPRGSRTRDDYFDYLGQNIDLAMLARLPAYSAWAREAEKALKGLKYL